MEPNLHTIFKQEANPNFSQSEILDKVFFNIKKENKKIIRSQKIIWSSISIIFFATTIATGWHAISGLFYSDTGNYISLIFSDTESITTVWKELSISIIESLPIIGIGLFLASIYMLLWSAKKFTIRTNILAY